MLNRGLWEQLSALVDAREAGDLAWHYVRGHVGTPGNERVDQIADTLARQGTIELYCGPLSDYRRDILHVPPDTTLPARARSSSRKPSGAPVYLSVVDGQLMRHATWAECERRVKGRSGARFKKAASPADEIAILRDWRIGAPGADGER